MSDDAVSDNIRRDDIEELDELVSVESTTAPLIDVDILAQPIEKQAALQWEEDEEALVTMETVRDFIQQQATLYDLA